MYTHFNIIQENALAPQNFLELILNVDNLLYGTQTFCSRRLIRDHKDTNTTFIHSFKWCHNFSSTFNTSRH